MKIIRIFLKKKMEDQNPRNWGLFSLTNRLKNFRPEKTVQILFRDISRKIKEKEPKIFQKSKFNKMKNSKREIPEDEFSNCLEISMR